MDGLPSVKQMRTIADGVADQNTALGDAAIGCIGELLAALREFVVEELEHAPGAGGYLTAFDNAVEREMAYLKGLPPTYRMELGLTLYTRGMLDEMEALHTLLETPLSGGDDEKRKQRERKKKGASTLKKELSKIWPSWLPKWIEEIIESVLELL